MMTNEMRTTDVDVKECWFCRRPVLAGERGHGAPPGRVAVHADCLREDALGDGLRPGHDDRATR